MLAKIVAGCGMHAFVDKKHGTLPSAVVEILLYGTKAFARKTFIQSLSKQCLYCVPSTRTLSSTFGASVQRALGVESCPKLLCVFKEREEIQ